MPVTRDDLIELLTLARQERDGEDRIMWAQKVLLITIGYFRSIDVDAELLQPLRDLIYALSDAEAGARNDFQPRPRAGRPPKAFLELANCARAAARVTFLIQRKTPAAVAIKQVAKDSQVDAKYLKEFRKNIQRCRVTERVRHLYQHHLEKLQRA
jgi:hypothetical protein